VKIIEHISDFLNPLKVDISLYRAISELVITKIKVPQLSIRAAKSSKIQRIFEDFKDTLEESSAYLLWKNPPKWVFEMQSNL